MRRLLPVVAALATAAAMAAAACSPLEEVEDGETALTNGGRREVVVDEDISLLVEAPETLRALEARGFDLGTQLSGAPYDGMAAFAASGEGASIIRVVEEDLDEAKRVDPTAGVGIARNHRLFDGGWLRSIVRWPAAVRPDLGGHAEYSLRVLARSGDELVPTVLENTPRADLSPEEQADLASWIVENIEEIDRGTAQIPDRFLATSAISVLPKGLARGQNRPFALMFGKAGERLPEVDLSGAVLTTTKTALLRRLDTMTCNGCHQSQGVAGFHVLGTDRKEVSDANALVDGTSPHTRARLAYRRTDLESVARGDARIEHVPFAERALGGSYGAACSLGDPGFASWTCDPGLECSDIDGDDLGICVSQGKRRAGQACEETDVSFSADPKTDRVKMGRVFACELPNGRAGRCARSDGGFPNGMCSGPCTTLGKVEGDAICGLSVPNGFNECIGARKPFETCIAGGTKQYRRACSATSPCGPDYVRMAVAGAPPGVGACMPPYFIFQARVDGHLVGP